MTTTTLVSMPGFDSWLDESPYRIDRWAQYAGHQPERKAYAIVDAFGWHVVSRNQVGRIDGHNRAARAAVRAALGGAK